MELTIEQFIVAMIDLLITYKDTEDTLGKREYLGDWKEDFDRWFQGQDKEAE